MALAIDATPNGSFDFKFVSFTENGSFVSHAVHKDVVATQETEACSPAEVEVEIGSRIRCQ